MAVKDASEPAYAKLRITLRIMRGRGAWPACGKMPARLDVKVLKGDESAKNNSCKAILGVGTGRTQFK